MSIYKVFHGAIGNFISGDFIGGPFVVYVIKDCGEFRKIVSSATGVSSASEADEIALEYCDTFGAELITPMLVEEVTK